jgi:hypothetical protein
VDKQGSIDLRGKWHPAVRFVDKQGSIDLRGKWHPDTLDSVHVFQSEEPLTVVYRGEQFRVWLFIEIMDMWAMDSSSNGDGYPRWCVDLKATSPDLYAGHALLRVIQEATGLDPETVPLEENLEHVAYAIMQFGIVPTITSIAGNNVRSLVNSAIKTATGIERSGFWPYLDNKVNAAGDTVLKELLG